MHELVSYGIKWYEELRNGTAALKPTSDDDANRHYNDIEEYPHMFVLACLMDRQVDSRSAWLIPYNLCLHFGTFEMEGLSKITLGKITDWFAKQRPHRFNEEMARVFYKGVQRIHSEYGGDASRIWSGRPGSAAIICRFLQFEGAGTKIATMAANTLARDYRVEMKDYRSIDVSPDVHVRRTFYRLGLTPTEDNPETTIFKARELSPEFPGIIGMACWEIGKTWCRPRNPKCTSCPLNRLCPYAASSGRS